MTICRKGESTLPNGGSSASLWETAKHGLGRSRKPGSSRTFSVSPDRVTVFEVEMGCETYRSNADDMRDAFAGFILMDFSTGMIFDFISTGQKIGAIYERLLIPGVTDEKTAFTYLIEAPFSGIR